MAINELAESGTRHFVLSHLSENNLPELAYWTNADYLRRKGAKVGEDVKLCRRTMAGKRLYRKHAEWGYDYYKEQAFP